ncbi:Lrp/AsnC ligand binding domain-containing protein [Marinomonas transparens]|uniref:Lrp/AsnC ligand binding domain-containing protein n=1 Tax=Marinomonas transparens TaxID=2795388 RepID=A0A934MXD6_9GAMM|nr:Lrp/AsnC ligand binding domain-containing protein [Marinomonas transparens]MBJ7539199.1 Lrp/AsnC ligand binding domain-containing protein [Marinomonas transparens]
MVTGIILLNVERTKTNHVAQSLASLEGVSEVFSVGGKVDLVVICRVTCNEDLADLIHIDIANDTRITHTETLIAFQAFSQFDLISLFKTADLEKRALGGKPKEQ